MDIELNKTIINNDCHSLKRYVSEDLQYMAIKIDNRTSHFHDILKVRTILSDNAFIKFKDWEWHEAGLPVLRTRYIELVEYERFLFLP